MTPTFPRELQGESPAADLERGSDGATVAAGPNADVQVPAPSPSRWARWVWVAILLCHVMRYVSWNEPDYTPGGDGFYIFMLSRSLAFDHDLDLTNDYAVCGDPWQVGFDAGTHRPANPYYIGPSTVWAPLLWLAHAVVPLPRDAPKIWRSACAGPIVYAIGFAGPCFVLLTCWAGYRIGRRWVPEAAALLAALLVSVASALVVYGTLWWNYAHVWAAGALTLAVLALVRVIERRDLTLRWAVCGALIGWSFLMRPHHAAFILGPFVVAVGEMIRVARTKRIPFAAAARGLVCLGAFLLVGSIRMLANQAIYGEPWPPITGTVYLQPMHAHPFLMLFSAQSGLLYHWPAMWFAVFGLGVFLRRTNLRPFVWPILVPFVLDWWMCASPLEWTGGATVGPRLLTSFCGIFVVWAALAFDVVGRWLAARPHRALAAAAAGWLLPLSLVSWQLVYGNKTAPALYADGFRAMLDDVYEGVGNPSTLPGTLMFALRYRTHPRHFDEVARYGMFHHDFHTGEPLASPMFRYAAPPPEVVLLEGYDGAAGGVRIRAGRPARFIGALSWPFITGIRVTAVPTGRSHGSVRLRGRAGTFFSRTKLREAQRSAAGLAPGSPITFELGAPEGAFDSGITEVILESNVDLTLTRFEWVDVSVHGTSTPLERARQRGTRAR